MPDRAAGAASRFVFRQQLSDEKNNASAPPSAERHNARTDASPIDGPDSHSPTRVLVVEDGADAADLLCELLEAEGYIVDLARDGVSAVQLAARRLPDVCVMDIGLPGMDGYEVAKRIRQLDHLRSAKLIAVTGWGSEVDRSRSHDAGFDVHMVKPIIYSELLAEISGDGRCREQASPPASDADKGVAFLNR